MCGRRNHIHHCGEVFSYKILPNKKLYPQDQPFSLNRSDSFFDFADIIVWNKLYRRSFLEENRIRFLSAKRAEDIYFTTIAVCSARKIMILPETLVHYRVMRSESLTGTIYQNPDEYLDVWMETAKELRKRGIFYDRCIANLAWASILWLIQRTRWAEYSSIYERVKTELVTDLGVRPDEPGYFFFPWQEELLKHLYQESAEDFLLSYLSIAEVRARKSIAIRQTQAEKSKKQINILENIVNEKKETIREQRTELNARSEKINMMTDELKALKNSWSFRIGRIFTLVPRKIKKR